MTTSWRGRFRIELFCVNLNEVIQSSHPFPIGLERSISNLAKPVPSRIAISKSIVSISPGSTSISNSSPNSPLIICRLGANRPIHKLYTLPPENEQSPLEVYEITVIPEFVTATEGLSPFISEKLGRFPLLSAPSFSTLILFV